MMNNLYMYDVLYSVCMCVCICLFCVYVLMHAFVYPMKVCISSFIVITHSCTLKQQIPYSGLFFLGAKFLEWVHNSGKFILECCMKFNCGLPL